MYKILLIGGEFVNKGAEAMIFSTKSLLEKYSVDPEIVVATYEKKNVGTKHQGLTVIGNKWLKGKAILYVKLLIPIIGKKLVKGNLLRRYEEIISFVREIYQQKKLVASICHAGWVLVSADVLKGRKATCFYAIKDDVVNAGAEFIDKEVVVDGNLITSRNPYDLPSFCREIIKFLKR